MLKMALFDCAINEKCCSVDGRRGICPLFSSPHRGIWQLETRESQPPGICHPRPKKCQCLGVSPAGGGWAQVGLTDALQIRFFSFAIFFYPLFTLYRTVNHTGQGFCSYIRAVILAQFSSVTKRTLRHSDLESVPHAGAVWTSMRHFHISHNAPYLLPQTFA